MIASNGSSSELPKICTNKLTVQDAGAGNLGRLGVMKIDVTSSNKEHTKILPVRDEDNQRQEEKRMRYEVRRMKTLRTRKAKENHVGNYERSCEEEQQTKAAPFKECHSNEMISQTREAKPTLERINEDSVIELDGMHRRENVAEEGDLEMCCVGNDTQHWQQDQNAKSRPQMRMQELQSLVAQLQKQQLSALRKEIGQAKDILDRIPKKECIRVKDVESAQKLVLQVAYNLFCRMEKEIITLHSTPNLLSYKVMVDRTVQIKKILKSTHDLDGLEEAVYDNILLTYKDILEIEERVRVLSDIANADTEKSIKKLVFQKIDSEDYRVDNRMNTANLPINPKFGSSHLKERTEII